MAISSRVLRLSKVQQKVRTDAIPPAPRMHTIGSGKLPDVDRWNEDFARWVEQLKNCMEPDPDSLDQNRSGS